MECQRDKNLENCPCSYPDCPRKGMCCECVAHHRSKGEVVACLFPAGEGEANSVEDRSVKRFGEEWKKHQKQVEEASTDKIN
jgi:hypothetical protein